MGSADLEPGIGIERPLENQVRESDRRLQRVADHILQHTVALEPARDAQLRDTLRVNENQHAQLFGLGPERMKFGIQELLAADAAADQRPA